ncbi:hypothetical protein F2P81_014248 [Scophthalmus maximus]|uniref:Zinc finger protein 865 n=1 Tax=Scophthalmus maximus TaxID=52904 RepID=A0A6A4SVS3_SCOMX|nr:hypothetical protein F2P81_014248 [Scophthalmus maximus]
MEMSAMQCFRECFEERFHAFVGEICGIFETIVAKYEDEIARQRRLLDYILKPEVKLHRMDLPKQLVCNEEQVPAEPKDSSPDQEDAELPQIKEEQVDLCISQEAEQLALKEETDDALILNPTCEESDQQLFPHRPPAPEAADHDGGDEPGSSTSKSKKRSHKANKCHSTLSKVSPNTCKFKTGFKCVTCGDAFKQKSQLNKHLRVHTGERRNSCKTCGRSFACNSDLLIHTRRHTGEKPYPCATCGKRFIDMSSLKTHMSVHTGEKPYSCKICGKHFRLGILYKVHMRTHSGERPYHCKTCGKSFGHVSNFKRHTVIHTDKRPYPCSTCGSAFRLKSELTAHVRDVHHGVQPVPVTSVGKYTVMMLNLPAV